MACSGEHKILIFLYFKDKNPIDVDVINYPGLIPAGLAKRINSTVDASVADIAKSAQFRILDFEIVE